MSVRAQAHMHLAGRAAVAPTPGGGYTETTLWLVPLCGMSLRPCAPVWVTGGQKQGSWWPRRHGFPALGLSLPACIVC